MPIKIGIPPADLPASASQIAEIRADLRIFLGDVADQAAMVALSTAVAGSDCYRLDTSTYWRLNALPASTADNWRELAPGASIAGGAGGDIDAITLVPSGAAQGQPASFQDGFAWVPTYDVNGDPTEYTIAGTAIATTVQKVGNYWRVTGSVKYTGGALTITGAQAAALKAAADGATTNIRHGARICVTEPGSGYVVGDYWWDATLVTPKFVYSALSVESGLPAAGDFTSTTPAAYAGHLRRIARQISTSPMNLTPVYRDGPAHGEATLAYEGQALLESGTVVFASLNVGYVGRYDPKATSVAPKGTYWRGNGGALIAGTTNWPSTYNLTFSSACLTPDGRVAFAQQDRSRWAIYDPYTELCVSPALTTGLSCAGIVQMPNGLLCGSPLQNTDVNLYDPATPASPASGGAHGRGSLAFSSCTLHPNGNVYFAPYNADRVGGYNYRNGAAGYFNGPVHGAGVSAAFEGAIVLPDGRILFVPNAATVVGLYDPVANTWANGASVGSNPGRYSGGCLLPGNRVLFFPRSGSHFGVYDITANSFQAIATGRGSVANSFVGGVMTPGGIVVLTPAASANVGLIYTHGSYADDLAMCLHPLYNKQ